MQGPTTTRASFSTHYSALETNVSDYEASGLHHLVTVHAFRRSQPAAYVGLFVCPSQYLRTQGRGGMSTQPYVHQAAAHWLGILASKILFGQNVIKHVDIQARSREYAEARAPYDMAWIPAHADAIWCDLEA